MTRRLPILFTLLIAALLAACTTGQATAPPPPTAAPTPQPTPEPTAAPTVEPAPGDTNYDVYLVAVDDGGASGPAIGCGDSLVAVTRGLAPADDDLARVALSDLLSMPDQYLGESGLYNALYQSDLTIESFSVEGSTAVVALSGELRMGGECDTPRVEAQLRQTITGVQGIDSAEITLNGQPLANVLDLSGGAGDAGSNPYDIYLVAVEDAGASGQEIGCGDSLVAVPRGTTGSGGDAVQAALTDLLGLSDQYLGQSGLYNALYQSDLSVEYVNVEGDAATVSLTGEVAVGGVCDEPRFTGQIEQTVLGIPGIESAAITVNGTPLDELFSQQ